MGGVPTETGIFPESAFALDREKNIGAKSFSRGHSPKDGNYAAS
jgi:hypothetical protein